MSDDDWDADDFEVPEAATAAKFADEDVEEEKPVTGAKKQSKYAEWSTEALIAELEKRDKDGKPKSQVGKKEQRKRLKEKEAAERAERKAREEEEAKVVELSPEEKLARKKSAQKLEEEADFELTKDLLGDEDGGDKIVLFEAMDPVSKEDFAAMAKAVLKKTSKYEDSPYYQEFAQDLARDLCLSMTAEQVKKVASSLEVLRSTKQKALQGKKKKNNKKAQLGGSGKSFDSGGRRGDDVFGGYGAEEYDDFM